MRSSGTVRVRMITDLGDLVIEVELARAPLSAGDFLRYVDRGLYDSAAFYRTVRAATDRGRPTIEVVQGGLLDWSQALPAIEHESTATTGLRHVHGTTSLARGAVGTGTAAAFFICIGDQPALDFGAERNEDGQGFAAFGRVVAGMDVVERIHQVPVKSESDIEYTRGQLLAKPVRILCVLRVC